MPSATAVSLACPRSMSTCKSSVCVTRSSGMQLTPKTQSGAGSCTKWHSQEWSSCQTIEPLQLSRHFCRVTEGAIESP